MENEGKSYMLCIDLLFMCVLTHLLTELTKE